MDGRENSSSGCILAKDFRRMAGANQLPITYVRVKDRRVFCLSSARPRLMPRGRRSVGVDVPFVQGLDCILSPTSEQIPMVFGSRQFPTHREQVQWFCAIKFTEGIVLKEETPWLLDLSYQHRHGSLRDEPVFNQRSHERFAAGKPIIFADREQVL